MASQVRLTQTAKAEIDTAYSFFMGNFLYIADLLLKTIPT